MRKKEILSILILGVLIIGAYFLFSFDADFTGHATTDSQVGNLSASIQTYMACTWSDETLDVSFGSLLNPGTDDINATQNYVWTNGGTMYNVTVDALSTSNADITIAGNDLMDSGNSIGIGNVTWAASESSASDNATMTAGSSTAITGGAVDIATGVASDSSVYYRFWLDIPSETVAGSYVGNYTLICEEAS